MLIGYGSGLRVQGVTCRLERFELRKITANHAAQPTPLP